MSRAKLRESATCLKTIGLSSGRFSTPGLRLVVTVHEAAKKGSSLPYEGGRYGDKRVRIPRRKT